MNKVTYNKVLDDKLAELRNEIFNCIRILDMLDEIDESEKYEESGFQIFFKPLS